jgi:hypothetical protein
MYGTYYVVHGTDIFHICQINKRPLYLHADDYIYLQMTGP